jgi:hypothetical protein
LALDSLFEITRFPAFLEALVENQEYRKVLHRPLDLIIQGDQGPLVVKDWIQFWENPQHAEGASMTPVAWRQLRQFGTDELQVVLRWLLDRVVREFGVAAPRKRGLRPALDLLSIVLHELARDTTPDAFVELMEQYLPLAQEPLMASDLYQWLFSCSFNPDAPAVDSLLLAVQGLEKAEAAGDTERIGWNAYNLVTYHSFFNADEALEILEKYVGTLQDDRYHDALGNIALKYLDEDDIDRGVAYLQSIWVYTLRAAGRGAIADLRSIGFNLVYYGLNLAWEYYEDAEYHRAIRVLGQLGVLLVKERQGFLEAAKDLGTRPVDWAYQYYVHLAECQLWLYACHEELGQEERAQDLLAEFQQLKLSCPYDLETIAKDFFQERGKGD